MEYVKRSMYGYLIFTNPYGEVNLISIKRHDDMNIHFTLNAFLQ